MNDRRSADQPLTRREPPGGPDAARLLVLLVVAVLVVAGSWSYAREKIAANEARRTLAEISTVLDSTLYDNQPHRDGIRLDTGSGRAVPVYRARRDGVPVAAALTVVTPNGFVGPILLLVGIAADGRVLGVRVSLHEETPGIGAAIAADDPAWLDVFDGRSLGDPPEMRWNVRPDGGDIDAIAGATVSSRAVVAGVRQALQYFATHRDEIFASRTEAGDD